LESLLKKTSHLGRRQYLGFGSIWILLSRRELWNFAYLIAPSVPEFNYPSDKA